MFETIPIPTLTNPEDFRLKIIGLGNAGCNILEHVLRRGTPNAEVIAVNTDSEALTASTAPRKVQIGYKTTRGLGAGGQTELGYKAAEESIEELRTAIAGASTVILCVGLGGGTASGAGRIISALAQHEKAFTIVVATLPFVFEGDRRQAQAEEALEAFHPHADAIICYPNDQMHKAAPANAAALEAVATSDRVMAQTVHALSGILRRRGLFSLGRDELAAALRVVHPRTAFGFATMEGDTRATDVVSAALSAPLLDGGKVFQQCGAALLHLTGGPDFRLTELHDTMNAFRERCGTNLHVMFGLGIDPEASGKVSLAIFGATSADGAHRVEAAAAAPASVGEPAAPAPVVPRQRTTKSPQRQNQRPGPTPAVRMAPRGRSSRPSVPVPVQEQMQFENSTDERFIKAQRTIVDGKDLDIPAYLRRNIYLPE